MNAAAEIKKKRKKKQPLVHGEVRKVMDVATGEILAAIVPMHPEDRAALRGRKLKYGDTVAMEIKSPRDVVQWRKAHVLGRFCVEQIEGFENLDPHAAVKRLQEEGDIECEHETFDLGSLGKVSRKVARSLSFDSMPEEVFRGVYAKLCDYLGRTYLGGIDEAAVLDMIRLMPAVQV